MAGAGTDTEDMAATEDRPIPVSEHRMPGSRDPALFPALLMPRPAPVPGCLTAAPAQGQPAPASRARGHIMPVHHAAQPCAPAAAQASSCEELHTAGATLLYVSLQAQGLPGPVHLVLPAEECRLVQHHLSLWPHSLLSRQTDTETAPAACQKAAAGALAADRLTPPVSAREAVSAPGTGTGTAPDLSLVLRRACPEETVCTAADEEPDDVPGGRSDGPDCQYARPADARPLEDAAPAAVPARGGYLLANDPTAEDGLREEETLAAALCSLGIAMVARLCQTSGLLSMHGALLAAPGHPDKGLVLLGGNRSGKSCLAVRLMAEGLRCYGDDMLGLEAEGRFVSFGLAPRLRLPLPKNETLATYAARHRGPGDARAFFLQADAGMLAPFATACRAGAMLLLSRQPEDGREAAPKLVRLCPEDALPLLIARFFMQEKSALQVLEAAAWLAGHVPCCVLHYTDLESAADFLCALVREGLPMPEADEQAADLTDRTHETGLQQTGALFGAEPGRMSQTDSPRDSLNPNRNQMQDSLSPARTGSQLPEDRRTEPSALPDPDPDPGRNYVHTAGSQCVTCLGLSFVLTADHNALHALNATSKAIWTMLADGLSIDEAVLLFSQTFSDAGEERIRTDMTRLFADLASAGLITPADLP